MEALEMIGTFILGIAGLVITAYLWGLFTDWLSKTTNTNISYHGKIVSRPHHHDENMKDISVAKDKLAVNAKALINKLTSFSEKQMTVAEKIKALKDLEELKKENIITQEQYETYKSKLL
ncbi:MAG: hypothetical protein JST46_17690 [Bacteroidetes bacterium]|nr:hypothetical protein [Bacteroidota bacterium]